MEITKGNYKAILTLKEHVKDEIRKVFQERFLRGPLGKLPVNSIPVNQIYPQTTWPELIKKSGLDPNDFDEDFGELCEAHLSISVEVANGLRSTQEFSDQKNIFLDEVQKLGKEIQDAVNIELKSLPGYSPQEQFKGFGPACYYAARIMCLARHFSTEEKSFGQLMYRIYQAGGFPCGWVGDCPKGKMMVYWPYKEPASFES